MAAVECPRCGLFCDPGAGACDCGYDFGKGSTQVVRSAPTRSKERILSPDDRARVVEGVRRYRLFLIVSIAYPLVGVLTRMAARLAPGGPETRSVVTLLSLPLVAVVAAAAAVTAYRAAEGLDLDNPVTWAVGSFFCGFFALLLMVGRARDWAERYGVRFGVLSPNREDVRRLVFDHEVGTKRGIRSTAP